jgi:Ca-activated chloride channel family protein
LPPGRDVVLLVDVSRSMAAEDAVPDRLSVAVESAVDLVSALGRASGQGNRAAVVAFAGRGVLRCPLTENLGAVTVTLRELRPGGVRPGGTDLGAALTAAFTAFGPEAEEQAGGRTIVLFSDGEDHAGTWDATVARLRGAGVIVHAVAIGDTDRGHPVPAGRGAETLRYHGDPVLSRRSDRPLAAIAETTGGAFVPIGLAPANLGDLYSRQIEPVARQKRQAFAFRASERAERFSWFVLAALAMGLLASRPGVGGRRSPRGRLLHRVGLLVILTLVSAMGVGPRQDLMTTAAEAVDAGRAAYDARRWADALAAFERAIALDPAAAVPRYDAAAALSQLGRPAEALEHYRQARIRTPAGAALQTKIDYSLGNTALALGDVAGAIAHYDACITSTARGSDLDVIRHDAAINRRFAKESARSSSAPPAPGPEEGSSPPPRSRPPGQDDPNTRRSRSGDSATAGGTGDSRGVTQRRGAGGAGGSGMAPQKAGTPEERLDAALERVRESRGRRLPAPPVADDATDLGNYKDW